jgi:hypothetical protein
MPLPSLENLTALEWLRLADNPEVNVKQFMTTRLLEGKPMDPHLLLDEFIWVCKVGMIGGVLKNLLAELSGNEAIHLLAQGVVVEKDAGPRPNFVYELAEYYESTIKKKPMNIFNELVWPALIELEMVKPDESGQIDPGLKEAARINYFNARQRRKNQKKRHSS